MDIDNKTLLNLINTLMHKEKEINEIKDTIAHAILDENGIDIGDRILLVNKATGIKCYCEVADATVVPVGDTVHKVIVARPDNVYEKLRFSLGDYDLCGVFPLEEDNPDNRINRHLV